MRTLFQLGGHTRFAGHLLGQSGRRWCIVMLLLCLVPPMALDAQTQEEDDLPQAIIPMMPYVEKESSKTIAGNLLVLNSVHTLNRNATVGAGHCTGLSLRRAYFDVVLDLGDDYEFGNHTFTAAVSLSIIGKDALGGQQESHTVALQIDFSSRLRRVACVTQFHRGHEVSCT